MKKYDKLVEKALIEYPITRKDDFILYATVIHYIEPNIVHQPIGVVLKAHKELGIPSFETITRARRKIQEENIELCDEETKEKRKQRELEFRKEYGRYE